MKKLVQFTLLVLLAGCNQKGNDQSLKPGEQIFDYGAKVDQILLGVEGISSQVTLTNDVKVESLGIILPSGSVLQKVDGDPSRFTYSLPEGYKVVGKGSDGKARELEGGSITCSCSSGKGCSPYVATLGKNQSIGCAVTGNCAKCSMSLLRGARQAATDEVLINPEIVNFSQNVHFVTTKAELSMLVSPTESLMQLDRVRQAIVTFARGFQADDLEALNKSTGPSDLPASYSYLHVNVYGRLIMLPVQTDLVLSANPLVNELRRNSSDPSGRVTNATVYKCKCSSGNAGCALNSGSLLFAKAVYCEAGNCASCTLSWL